MVSAEGYDLDYALVSNETTHRVGHQRAADARTAGMLGDDQPAHVVRRGFGAEEQAAERVRLFGGRRDESGPPADVLRDRRQECRLTDHRAEPVLDLSREPDEAGSVLLPCESDYHRNSLTQDRDARHGDTWGMLRVGTVVLNVKDTRRASHFWSQALGYAYQGGGYSEDATTVLVPPAATPVAMALDEDDRTHLDLHTDSAREQQAEVERLISLGATRVDWTYPEGARFVVLADPEGNHFCVINTAG